MSLPPAARAAVEDAIAAGVFPAAAIEVGTSDRAVFGEALGRLTFDQAAPVALRDTVFDLASLTKVIATTTVVMELMRAGTLRLEEPVAAFFGEWRGGDREAVSVRDLLEHASGLPARLWDAPPSGRREFEHDICTMRLEYTPRTQSVYSDLGFILLGFLSEDRGGATLDELFRRITVRLKPDTTDLGKHSPGHEPGPGTDLRDHSPGRERDPGSVRLQPGLLTFALPPDVRGLAAPTRPMDEDSRRGRVLTGEVHDNYAAALGGVAGHAGLFGNAAGVGAFARTILGAARQREPLASLFTAKSSVPGSSRALGWDTMLPTSSCGRRMSPAAFGHVGYTGASLWIDPVRDRYFVLLTNRAFGGGTLDQMRTVRRAFHDALGDL